MRKFLVILSLCCLLFIVSGYSLLYQIRLAEIKADVKKELLQTKKEQLTQLVFTPSAFAALDREGESELRYENVMYDVVAIEKRNGEIRCWCLPDKKETALIAHYLKTQNSSEKSPSQSLVKLLKLSFLPVSVLRPELNSRNHTASFSFYAFPFSSFNPSVLAPPPKFC